MDGTACAKELYAGCPATGIFSLDGGGQLARGWGRAGPTHGFGQLWQKTFKVRLSTAAPKVTYTRSLIDPRVQWKQWRNIWYNAGIRTPLLMPVNFAKKLFGRA